MTIFDEHQVKLIAENAFNEYESTFKPSELKTISDMFYSLMKEEVNKNKDSKQQVAMIQSIVYDYTMYSIQENPQRSFEQEEFRHNGDIKHIAYFDTFLGEGKSDEILKTLAQYKIPSVVLKGLKPNIPFERTKVFKNVEIEQEVIAPPGETPSISGFAIYYKGEKVYGFGNLEFDEEDDAEEEDIEVQIARYFQTISGKTSKSRLIDTITLDYGDVTTTVRKIIDSRGRVRYIDEKGRFTRKV